MDIGCDLPLLPFFHLPNEKTKLPLRNRHFSCLFWAMQHPRPDWAARAPAGGPYKGQLDWPPGPTRLPKQKQNKIILARP